MNSFALHPATRQLLKFQAHARLRRMLRGFRTPRRFVLSCLALLLSVIWLSNAALSVLFREPSTPAELRRWIPFGLLAYGLWHVLKAACRKPTEPFEWTDAERELMSGAPLRRRELVMYRLAGIAGSTVLKAGLFAVLMLPDLKVWPAGFLGMFLALIFLDFQRMAAEIFAYGLSKRSFVRFRIAALVIAGGCLTSALVSTLCAPNPGRDVAAIKMMLRFVNESVELRTTWVGVVAELPYRAFSQVILADSVSLRLGFWLLLTTTMVVAMMKAVIWLDAACIRIRNARERSGFANLGDSAEQAGAVKRSQRTVRVPCRFAGAGTLAWRQALGTHHYRAPILVAFIVPTILSLLPVVSGKDGLTTMVHVTGALIFYSFILLPTAIKMDFRRDGNRLAVLKSLPVSPTAVTVGQLTVPVVICTLFQIAVLLVAMFFRPFHPACLIAAIAVLVPVNILIFSLDNLIFMLYPHRLNQEGVEVFLRTILTFTGKGILFGIGLSVTLIWLWMSEQLGLMLFDSGKTGGVLLFVAGMWTFTSLAALGSATLLVLAYRRFDASQDTPA